MAQSTDIVTNQTIIRLKDAGLSNEIIKAKIENSECEFDLSTDSLIFLKKANISDDVINTMFTKTNNNAQTITTANASDNIYNLPSGIYYLDDQNQPEELEPSILTNSKSGGAGEFFERAFISGLINAKVSATVKGSRSDVHINNTKPVFIFVFDSTAGGLNNNAFTSSVESPKEFFLVKMKQTKDTREIVVGKSNSISSNIGVDDRIKIEFSSEKIKKALYKVTAVEDLIPGEYCFMFSSSSMYQGASAKIYDFSIQ